MSRIIITTIFIVFSTPALAYLDPGSGSMLLYFLVGVFSALVYSIKNLFFEVKLSISQLLAKDKIAIKDKKDIVFYSEGGFYWSTFEPVICELSRMNIKCSYYTSDKNDKGLKFQSKNVDTLFIGDGNFSLMSLNYLKTKILVMTTSQLDVMHLKRSPEVDYFIHLVHAPTDVFAYEPFAFDYFDCVMCSGQHQIDHLRLIEKARGAPNKILLKTGLVYFDNLLRRKSTSISKQKSGKKTVLVAPSWKSSSMLRSTGFKVLEVLANNGFNVILRPHPQSYINDLELMRSIEHKCEQFDAITIDKNNSANNSMMLSDVMVSDTSGVIYDFAFVYEKPVIAFDDTLDLDSLLELVEVNNMQETHVDVWEVKTKHKVATKICSNQIDSLPKTINQIVNDDCKGDLRRFRDESVFNYGNAGKVAAKQLKHILDRL